MMNVPKEGIRLNVAALLDDNSSAQTLHAISDAYGVKTEGMEWLNIALAAYGQDFLATGEHKKAAPLCDDTLEFNSRQGHGALLTMTLPAAFADRLKSGEFGPPPEAGPAEVGGMFGNYNAAPIATYTLHAPLTPMEEALLQAPQVQFMKALGERLNEAYGEKAATWEVVVKPAHIDPDTGFRHMAKPREVPSRAYMTLDIDKNIFCEKILPDVEKTLFDISQARPSLLLQANRDIAEATGQAGGRKY